MDEQYYYSPSLGQTYSAFQMQALFGINTETTSLEIINYIGFYPVQPSAPDFDVQLYNPVGTWSLTSITDGEGAIRVYTPDPKPLPEAKENGSAEAKTAANAAVNTLACDCGFSNDLLTGVASQDYFDRAARYQAELDEIAAVATQLDADLTAIDNAPNVDTIDSILRHPSGTIMTGRGGLGPDDMQPSYFTVLENLPPGIGEPQLEIYIPGTDTVIPYDAGLPEPYKFDSMGDCYNTGDYRTVIRVTATGQVLSTVYPAEGAQAPIEWAYNPNIPSYGGGSSSHHSA
jgi:hypothetical protein